MKWYQVLMWLALGFGIGLLVSSCQVAPVAPNPQPVIGPPQQMIQKAMNLPWLITTSILGIAGGVAGMLFLPGPGKTIALALVAFCVVSLGLTLLVAQYAQWLVLGTVVACVGVGIYALSRVKKALPELVQTVEAAKAHLTIEAKELLFGKDKPTAAKDGNGTISGGIQSPSTEAIVGAIRNG